MKNALIFTGLLLLTSTNFANAQVLAQSYKSLDPQKQKEFRQLFLDSYVELLNDKIPNKFDNYTTLSKANHDNADLFFEYTINSEGMKLLEKNGNAKYFMQEMSLKEVCKKKETEALWLLNVNLNYNYYYYNKNEKIKLHGFVINQKDCLDQQIL